MRKLILIVLVLVVLALTLFAKIIPLPEVVNPQSLVLDSKRIFIAENESVFIYSLADFKLLKKFGRRGQGPGEFLTVPGVSLKLYIQSGYLFVNSISKVSIFTKDGEFVKEMKTPNPGSRYQPLGKMFVGSSVIREDNVQYLTVNVYDSNFEKVPSRIKERDILELLPYSIEKAIKFIS